jgi:drug/metabolite transporter (DMT)-like permease
MFLGVSAIWGASYLQIKIALDGLNASVIVFGRVLIAAVLLYFAVRALTDRARAFAFARRHLWEIAVLGFFSITAPFMLISYGETQISSGLTGILIAPGPLFIALLAPFIDPSEKVDRRGAVGLTIGFAGVVLLIGVDTVDHVGEFLGAIAMLAAALSYGLGALYAKNRFSGEGVPPIVMSFFSCAAASLMTLPPALATLPGSSPDLGEIAAVVGLGAIGTALAFYLYYTLISEVGAGRALLVGYMIPPSALLYGAILLDEEITPASIVGLMLILVGVALASRTRGVEAPSAAAPEPALAAIERSPPR